MNDNYPFRDRMECRVGRMSSNIGRAPDIFATTFRLIASRSSDTPHDYAGFADAGSRKVQSSHESVVLN